MNGIERAARAQHERYRLGVANRERINRLEEMRAQIEDDEFECNHTPTTEEIAEACEAFRREWTPAIRAARRVEIVDPVSVSEVSEGPRRRANQGGCELWTDPRERSAGR